ncbi:hypothetical protein [Sphaerimonospora thailandensis]|uniref:HK97 family phage major capsid protein n=1 Tax=Sphaerimonospora thailandensis TaxID=795644 RepID=A0A8J3R580_9ACTN|nr:hypothetical protein [Sphaerimonospora thailandensis]GIH69446.1 hypothetical protein Mth01_16990 [Sphaerimonospora thailandensis]
MTLAQLLAQLRGQMASKLEQRNTHAKELATLRGQDDPDEARVAELRKAKDDLDAELDQMQARAAEYEAELARDDAADRLAREVTPGADKPRYDQVARVGAEARTYRPDLDPRGQVFLRDVARAFVMRDFAATDRLMAHLREERVERGEYMNRATGTGNFDGLTVPQYLTDMFAKHAKAGRPFANAIRSHDLPAEGMNVYIGRGTTGTDTGVQSAQGDAATDQGFDDTLLTIPVQTNAGQQTMSRQAVERTSGALDVTMEDLFRAYGTKLDHTLINQATTGLSAVATAVTYTDTTPTVEEFWPKIQEGLAGVETALLDQVTADSFLAVMHPRRWRWMNQALTSKWPLIQQPGMDARSGGLNYGEVYGSGFRGLLPDGTPVVVDANVPAGLGTGTNEDEVYVLSRDECHLWEDPDAPFFIRAEETKAASVQILFVVYGYFAYTHARYAQARKIAGTGLATPTFSGQ